MQQQQQPPLPEYVQGEASPATFKHKVMKKQAFAATQPSWKDKRKYKSSPWLFSAVLGMVPGFALITATLATLVRFFSGLTVRKGCLGTRPAKNLKLYEFEGDPNSRLVREALTMLDLDCVIMPCPKGSKKFRNEAIRIGGKEKFPLLVDENTDRKLYGARNIVPYLFRTYGDGQIPFVLRMPFMGLSSFFASLLRGFRGIRKQKGAKDVQIEPTSIELYSYEAAPHCRLVREVLSELEIPYLLRNVGKRSANRKRFVEKSGRMMVPYLIDNNTEKGSQGMFESCDIIKYLQKTYGRNY